MNIVLISADYPPTAGGVADHTYHLGHALASLGHQVQVLTSRRADCSVPAEQKCSAVDVAPIVGSWGMAGVVSAARWVSEAAPDLVGLQYVPTMYGRGGVAPSLFACARAPAPPPPTPAPPPPPRGGAGGGPPPRGGARGGGARPPLACRFELTGPRPRLRLYPV